MLVHFLEDHSGSFSLSNVGEFKDVWKETNSLVVSLVKIWMDASQPSKTAKASHGLEIHIEPSTMKIDDAFYLYLSSHWLCLTWQSNRMFFLEWMASWFSSSEGVVNWNISSMHWSTVSVLIPCPVVRLAKQNTTYHIWWSKHSTNPEKKSSQTKNNQTHQEFSFLII